MILQQTLEHARPSRRTVDRPHFRGYVTDLVIAEAAAPAPRPQSFLVEQAPGWSLATHYHQEHQFQVFVRGAAHLGRTPVERLTVHYASPHAAYGPLVAGSDGVAYLTLRAVGDIGAWYLPAQREHLLVRIPKHQVHGTPVSRHTAETLRTLARVEIEAVIAPEETGLAAWIVRLPPGSRSDGPTAASAHGGRFTVVTGGSLHLMDDELPALATVWSGPEDRFDLRAGGDGLEVVVVQFPLSAATSFIECMDRQAVPPGYPSQYPPPRPALPDPPAAT